MTTAIIPTDRQITGLVLAARNPIPGSAFCLVTLDGGQSLKGQAEPGILEKGQVYRFHGEWLEHADYGMQFNFQFFDQPCPVDRAGVMAYLTRTCKGISKVNAGRIFDIYGPEFSESIRTDPCGVAEACGLEVQVVQDAGLTLLSLKETEAARLGLYQLFAGRGFPKTAIEACIVQWGNRAHERVMANPFQLLLHKITGCGFKRVDPLYLECGGNPGSIQRQVYAGWSELGSDTSGNTWTIDGIFNRGVCRHIPPNLADPDKALRLGLLNGLLRSQVDKSGFQWLAEARKAINEKSLAYHLIRLGSHPESHWPAIPAGKVSQHQAEAWDYLRQYAVCFLTGTPGTGKTYTASAILGELSRCSAPGQVAVCAPTGKAAVRIQESMLKLGLGIEASTIHRLLACQPGTGHGRQWEFAFNEKNKLPYRFIIVDEVSMLDTDLAADLLRACADGSHLLFLGDPFQLPPVQHGAVLRDCLAANVPNRLLTEVKRNAGAIVQGCASLRQGEMFETYSRLDAEKGENLVLVDCQNDDSQLVALRGLVGAVQGLGKYDPVWQLQVLTPRNEDSLVARKNLNLVLQAILNPVNNGNTDAVAGTFRLRDKVICLSNTWIQLFYCSSVARPATFKSFRPVFDENGQPQKTLIANGDQGGVLALDPKAGAMIVEFQAPSRIVKVLAGKGKAKDNGDGEAKAEDFALSYAITGHKSQGSEWPIGIIIADPNGGRVASREWWTTAISRFQIGAFILGDSRVIAKQISRTVLPDRKTFLRELLTEEIHNDLLGP